MPHIQLPEGLPGILGPMAFSPETARPLNDLAEVLLRSDNTLTRAERELIAAYVSSLNECRFCRASHAAVAAYHLDGDTELVQAVERDLQTAPVSDKLRSLLAIAGKVQKSGRDVSADDIARAHSEGATDKEIHDAVLIAAAFSMYNRYVDGLATIPADSEAYEQSAVRLAEHGYAATSEFLAAS
jgi:uncharacterized peroxidase-related enzyme